MTDLLPFIFVLGAGLFLIFLIWRWHKIESDWHKKFLEMELERYKKQKERVYLYKINEAELFKRKKHLTDHEIADALYKLYSFNFPIFEDMQVK